MENQIKMKVRLGEKHFLVELGQEVVITKELIKAMPDKFEVENELEFERGKVYTVISENKWTGTVKEIISDRIMFHQLLCHDDEYYDTDNAYLLNTNIRSFYLATPEEIALLEEADRKHGLKFNPVTMELEELPKEFEVWTFETLEGRSISRIKNFVDISRIESYAVKLPCGDFLQDINYGFTILPKKYKSGDAELAEAAKKVGRVWDDKLKQYVNIEKSFEDYEKEFYSSIKANLDIDYDILKKTHPKQYYQIIGQFIADDLNGDWKSDNTSSNTEYIVCWTHKRGFYIDDRGASKRGHIRFATEEIGNKFLEIMGDHLNQLY